MRRSRASHFPMLLPFLLLPLLAAMPSCGGGGGGGAPVTGTQMGGAIQGIPLTLANTTRTAAGSPLTGSADGVGTAASFFRPGGAVALGGFLYIADSGNSTIRRMSTVTGEVTTLAGSPGSSGTADGTGSAARFNGPGGIATDGLSLYVTDMGNHTIRKVTFAGVVTTLAGVPASSGHQDGFAARFNYPYDVAVGPDLAYLYVADTCNHTIRKVRIADGQVTTLAGFAEDCGSADGGPAARFCYPVGVAADLTHLYVSDNENHTIRKVSISTAAVTTLAGTAGEYGTADGTGSAARFHQPWGVAVDGTDLYVVDYSNQTIRKVGTSSGAVTTVAGGTGEAGSADGVGTAARFRYPRGLATDGTNLYVADYENHSIRRMAIVGAQVSTAAGGAGSYGSADGVRTLARFNLPYDVTTDGANLYVADGENDTIRRVSISSGAVTTLAGLAGSPGTADGTGSAARFNNPRGITTDGTNLYVADKNNYTIRKVVIATGAVTTLAGLAESYGSADGTGPAARFLSPCGITTDGMNLYVADTGNHTIRKIVISTGEVTTPAGLAGSSGFDDGTGPAARFDEPEGLTTDGTSLYVADTGNHTIRRVAIATAGVTTLAGLAGSSGVLDGTGSAARFYRPCGVTTDGTSLFVADTFNMLIRKVVIATGAVTTISGGAEIPGSADGGGAARYYMPSGITTDGADLYVADGGNNTIRRIY